MDGVINFLIMTEGVSDEAQCILGIITTMTFHFIALGSILLRAYRIRKFFDVYEEYFKNHEILMRKRSMVRHSVELELPQGCGV